MNATGRKMTISEIDVATTASVTSRVPSIAAWNGGVPSSSMCLKIFSRTTIASSITMPTASVSPRSVMLFSVKPADRISAKLAMMEAGIASAETITTRRLRMKTMITRLASRLPKIRCSSSDEIDAWMKRESSRVTVIFTSRGITRWSCASLFLTPSATCTVFWPDCRRTSMTTVRWPSKKAAVRTSSVASSTAATSRTRIGVPFAVATTMFEN